MSSASTHFYVDFGTTLLLKVFLGWERKSQRKNENEPIQHKLSSMQRNWWMCCFEEGHQSLQWPSSFHNAASFLTEWNVRLWWFCIKKRDDWPCSIWSYRRWEGNNLLVFICLRPLSNERLLPIWRCSWHKQQILHSLHLFLGTIVLLSLPRGQTDSSREKHLKIDTNDDDDLPCECCLHSSNSSVNFVRRKMSKVLQRKQWKGSMRFCSMCNVQFVILQITPSSIHVKTAKKSPPIHMWNRTFTSTLKKKTEFSFDELSPLSRTLFKAKCKSMTDGVE